MDKRILIMALFVSILLVSGCSEETAVGDSEANSETVDTENGLQETEIETPEQTQSEIGEELTFNEFKEEIGERPGDFYIKYRAALTFSGEPQNLIQETYQKGLQRHFTKTVDQDTGEERRTYTSGNTHLYICQLQENWDCIHSDGATAVYQTLQGVDYSVKSPGLSYTRAANRMVAGVNAKCYEYNGEIQGVEIEGITCYNTSNSLALYHSLISTIIASGQEIIQEYEAIEFNYSLPEGVFELPEDANIREFADMFN